MILKSLSCGLSIVEDVARLELVCKFIGSQKRKEWFGSGKIKLGHEKAENISGAEKN